MDSDTNYIYNLQAFDTSKGIKIYDSGDHLVKTLKTFIKEVSFYSEPGFLVSLQLGQHFNTEKFLEFFFHSGFGGEMLSTMDTRDQRDMKSELFVLL